MVKGNKYFETENWKQMSAQLKSKEWKEVAKIVREMKNEFIEKVKAAEKIATVEKRKKKQKKTEKCLQLLELIKMHGGPITTNELEKLDQITEAQLISEVRYLRQTLAPNIREKRKVGNKFEKFSREELKNQILNVLKPETDYVEDIDTLLLATMKDKIADGHEDDNKEDDVIGKLVIAEGVLGERKVGLVMSEEAIQLYHLTRYGFEPDDLKDALKDWKVVSEIEDYDFITKRTGVYLRCSVKVT